MPTDKTPFAALPSIFGGERDHLVLRVATGQRLSLLVYIRAMTSFTAGRIFVWERDSATMLHCIRAPPALEGCITSFAWNRGSANYMFATGTRDGTVHIWTASASEENHDGHMQQLPIYGEELTSEPQRWSRDSIRRLSSGFLTVSSSSTVDESESVIVF